MRHAATATLVLIGVLALTGCATTANSAAKQADTYELRLSPSGTLQFDGKETPVDHLVKQLRSAGATPDSSIVIDIPADTPLSRVTAITGQLASAGYRKIIFKRPRHTEVSVKSAAQP